MKRKCHFLKEKSKKIEPMPIVVQEKGPSKVKTYQLSNRRMQSIRDYFLFRKNGSNLKEDEFPQKQNDIKI